MMNYNSKAINISNGFLTNWVVFLCADFDEEGEEESFYIAPRRFMHLKVKKDSAVNVVLYNQEHGFLKKVPVTKKKYYDVAIILRVFCVDTESYNNNIEDFHYCYEGKVVSMSILLNDKLKRFTREEHRLYWKRYRSRYYRKMKACGLKEMCYELQMNDRALLVLYEHGQGVGEIYTYLVNPITVCPGKEIYTLEYRQRADYREKAKLSFFYNEFKKIYMGDYSNITLIPDLVNTTNCNDEIKICSRDKAIILFSYNFAQRIKSYSREEVGRYFHNDAFSINMYGAKQLDYMNHIRGDKCAMLFSCL